MYQLSLENFSGPMEKLLELIEQKKLDITSISLAEVTADFISYTRELKKAYEDQAAKQDDAQKLKTYTRLISDFLVIAAQLLFIKSRSLLPQMSFGEDDEESAFDLERQLRVYSSMKPIFGELKRFWTESDQSFSRDYLKTIQPIFYPPAGLTPDDLMSAFEKATVVVTSFVREEQTIERQLVTLEEKIEELSRSVIQGAQNFASFASEKSKHETIVLFLALLHLLRDRTVYAKQEGQFGEIEFQRNSTQTPMEHE